MSRTFVAIFTLWALSGGPRAQAAELVPSADWTGFYTMARGKALDGLVPEHMNLNAVVTAHLQPWAKAKMEATDGVADDTGGVCQPDGIFRYPAMAGSFLWLPSADKILIVYGPQAISTAGVQRIYMNRKEHPRNLLPTWNGDSIGHWEGDTLVVDTVGFNTKSWLQPGMQPHTEETHMIQRIRTVKDGAFIEMQWKIEDRLALTSAYTYSRYYRKAGTEMREEICSDDIEVWKDFRDKRLKPQMEKAHEVR